MAAFSASAILIACLLLLWGHEAEANVRLPIYGNAEIGFALAAGGLALVLEATHRRLRAGGRMLVNRGAYSWIPHPIYTGFAAVCAGVSMIAGSAAGLWLITPAVVLACTAFVLGVERPELLRRFGSTLRLLPRDDTNRPRTRDGVQFFLVVVVPWLALFEFTSHMRLPGTPFGFPFEDHMRVLPWTAVVYETSYLTVAFAPVWTRTNHQLRQLTISAWVAMALVFPVYWIMPSAAPRRPMVDDSWISHLLYQERDLPPTAAFPSFHVLWAIFVGRLWPRWLGIAYTLSIAVSCVTTGMHYIPDALASLLISPLLLEPGRRLWTPLLRLVERAAMGQTVAAALAAAVQAAIVSAVMGDGNEWKAIGTVLAGLLAAGLWTRWSQASAFYGALLGTAIACLIFPDRWTLLAANALAAPWTLALIRLSSPAPAPLRLASILTHALLGLVLFRLGASGSAPPLICGVCAIGLGLIRFAEEPLRRTEQLIAIALAAAGAALTTVVVT